ncbi:MAG: SIS domain-containing protein [Sphingomonadales bacterium]|nr:SIS domain-containing protein [Sphingomonadales bacterium]MBM3924117.1 SIS domain-containing protein [Sphingomonadales bacterium]MBM3932339.1 SIS domain-containing protein [Sphingomonadales bacterium]
MNPVLRNEIEQMRRLELDFYGDQGLMEGIEEAAKVMAEALEAGHKIICCGNGGSMSDAMHLAEELSGRYRSNRRALAAIALSDPGFLTCAANDMGYDAVFERGIEALGQFGDVLIAISTSGNSPNILKACHKARSLNLRVIGLSAGNGGSLPSHADLCLLVPTEGYADRAQEFHIRIIHLWIALIEYRLKLS